MGQVVHDVNDRIRAETETLSGYGYDLDLIQIRSTVWVGRKVMKKAARKY